MILDRIEVIYVTGVNEPQTINSRASYWKQQREIAAVFQLMTPLKLRIA
jgi:hypothetical protein